MSVANERPWNHNSMKKVSFCNFQIKNLPLIAGFGRFLDRTCATLCKSMVLMSHVCFLPSGQPLKKYTPTQNAVMFTSVIYKFYAFTLMLCVIPGKGRD